MKLNKKDIQVLNSAFNIGMLDCRDALVRSPAESQRMNEYINSLEWCSSELCIRAMESYLEGWDNFMRGVSI